MTISRIRASSGSALTTWLDRFVLTIKDLKFRFRTSAMHWLPKILSYASTLPWLSMRWIPLPHQRSASTTHDVTWVPFRTSALPIFQKMWSSTSAFPSCIDCLDLKFCFRTSVLQGLLKVWSFAFAFRSALTAICAKYVKYLSPHFCSARTSKYLKLRFRTCSIRTSKDVKVHFRISSLQGLPKMWSSLPHFCSVLTVGGLQFRFPSNTLL